eukprot:CAMPEP_0174704396 /NCGR_PEP_ID=MMETSP1094-20130205/8005_1 /TAXON_ID=156173 /ORGANISM="Chrysochromulina brevifilum, Strain UTEX LB 985" /LENGTH=73 /DNA_ID=CAMNT_0015902445 /DNA_START=144 /DNA_END=366 /DNA_ORIENTATION=+
MTSQHVVRHAEPIRFVGGAHVLMSEASSCVPCCCPTQSSPTCVCPTRHSVQYNALDAAAEARLRHVAGDRVKF